MKKGQDELIKFFSILLIVISLILLTGILLYPLFSASSENAGGKECNTQQALTSGISSEPTTGNLSETELSESELSESEQKARTLLAEGRKSFTSLQAIDDYYLCHWQDTLLKEGIISQKSDIYYLSDNFNAEVTKPEDLSEDEDRELIIELTSVDEEFHFWFCRTVLNFRYVNHKFYATLGEDFLCCEISTLEDALHFPMNFSYPYQRDENPWWSPSHGKNFAEMAGEYAKENDARRYEALQDPMTAAEEFLRLSGGSGEFIRNSTNSGTIVYTFADGTKAHIAMCQTEDIWWPLYLIDQYTEFEMAEEWVEQDRRIGNILESADADMLRAVAVQVGEGCQYDEIFLGLDENSQDDMEGSSQFLLIKDFPAQDAAVYGLCGGGGMVLRVKDQAYPVYDAWDIYYAFPDFYAGDYDGDGVYEYAFRQQNGRGTGVSTFGLYVLDIVDEELQVREFTWDNWDIQLQMRLSHEFSDGILQILDDGELLFRTDEVQAFLDDMEQDFRAIAWGDIMDFEFRDGWWYFHANIGVCTNEWATPNYECPMMILSPIRYTPEGDFYLGDIYVERDYEFYHYGFHYGAETDMDSPKDGGYSGNAEDGQYGECIVYSVRTDITHDGTEDVIVTSVTYHREDWESKSVAELLADGERYRVSVFDGNYLNELSNSGNSDATGSDGADFDVSKLNMSRAIWQKEYAPTNSGESKLYLAKKNGLYYLLENDGNYEGPEMFHGKMWVFSMNEYGLAFPETIDAAGTDGWMGGATLTNLLSGGKTSWTELRQRYVQTLVDSLTNHGDKVPYEELYALCKPRKANSFLNGVWNRTNIHSGSAGELSISGASREGFSYEMQVIYFTHSGCVGGDAYFVTDSLAISRPDLEWSEDAQYMAFLFTAEGVTVRSTGNSNDLGLGMNCVVVGDYVRGKPVYANANILQETFTKHDLEILQEIVPQPYYENYFLDITENGCVDADTKTDGTREISAYMPTMGGTGYELTISPDEEYRIKLGGRIFSTKDHIQWQVFDSAADAQDYYRDYWAKKLLSEGLLIHRKSEIYSVNCPDVIAYRNTRGEELSINVQVLTLDSEYHCGFYCTKLICIYYDEAICVCDAKDFVNQEIRSLTETEPLSGWMPFAKPPIEQNLKQSHSLNQPTEMLAVERARSWYDFPLFSDKITAYVKEHDTARYLALQNPVTAVEELLQLAGGSGEFVRGHDNDRGEAGYVVYTFADGTCASFHVYQYDGCWYPSTFTAEQVLWIPTWRTDNELLENATAESLRTSANIDYEQDTCDMAEVQMLAELPEQNAVLYALGNYGDMDVGMVLVVGEQAYPIYAESTTFAYNLPDSYNLSECERGHCTDLCAGDYDGDGDLEYAIANGDFYILDITDDDWQFTRFSYYEMAEQFVQRISYTYQGEIVKIYVDGVLIGEVDAVDRTSPDSEEQKFAYLNCYSFWGSFQDGEWFVETTVYRMTKEEDGRELIHSELVNLTSKVDVLPDGSFQLGEIFTKQEANVIFIIGNTIAKENFYEVGQYEIGVGEETRSI